MNLPIQLRNPWDFYKPFRILSSSLSLVLCEDETEVRTMRIFGNASTEDGVEFPILEIPHPSFVVIREGYLFRNEIFTILEYVGFSVEDLLQHSIYPQEGEIAYIISQVLAGVRFVWSMGFSHPRISIQNILISSKGEVKIDQTLFPDNDEHTSANLNSLGTVMLRMMNETRESLKSTAQDWTAGALDFVEATSSAAPDELSDHEFVNCLKGSAVLTPLCTLAHLQIAPAKRSKRK